jgi:hypothetical protein
LEKSKIKTKTYYNYHEFFPALLWLCFIMLMVEIIISNVILGIVP